ncbi:hypothetical protein [Streptomyces rimosus]|uniref:hypothetical protein n=1 Tax=Streptomyces rimosus TaxID=1927 RepID=UPI0004C02952|nr:hypothetical protein [Streptomyces rimosus]
MKRWSPEGRYGGTDVHHVVLRDEHTNLAVSHVHAPTVGSRLHLHGTWRQRLDGDAWIDDFTGARLWAPPPVHDRPGGGQAPGPAQVLRGAVHLPVPPARRRHRLTRPHDRKETATADVNSVCTMCNRDLGEDE